MLTAVQLSNEMAYDHVIVRLFSAVFTDIAEFTIKEKLDQLKFVLSAIIPHQWGSRNIPLSCFSLKIQNRGSLPLVTAH